MIEIPQDLSPAEQRYLDAALRLVGGSPSLESIWGLMDLAWVDCQFRGGALSVENLQRFYSHPVWLLNGLFIEQHAESLRHRESFASAVVACNPLSVCDYGGGFGGLARLIAKSCTEAGVDLFDPFPHQAALMLSSPFPNLRHVNELNGPYDVMVATDVFEHVNDPLLEVQKSARHLLIGGKYLIANCFYPVIKCHLPETFHLRDTFNTILAEMNLVPLRQIAYGTLFEKTGEVQVTQRIRRLERKSRLGFAWQGARSALHNLKQLWLG